MGRHGDPYGEAPPWDRGEYPADAEVPRPRRLRAALLLAVAFVATVTGVIAGVRLLAASQTGAASPAGLGLPCPPGAGCEALFPSEVKPSATQTGGPAAVPTARPSAGRPDAGGPSNGQAGSDRPTVTPPTADPPTVVPSPRASRTPVVSLSPKPSPTGRGEAGVERARPSVSAPPTVVKTATQAPPRVRTEAPRDPESARSERAVAAPRQAVVKFTVIRQARGRYAAEIAIGNEGRGDLRGWEISLPIDGRALAVDGAAARQLGDLLVISSDELLPPGGGVAVTIAVQGDTISPDFCRLRGGSCRVL